MIFNVLRQPFTVIHPLFQFGVSNITTNDNRAIQRNGILRQLCEDLFHRTVKVNAHRFAFSRFAQLFRDIFAWIMFQFFDPNPLTVDLCFDITVSRTRDAHTDRAGCAVTWQANHADVVSEVFTAKLRTQTKILRFDQQFFFQFHIAERLSVLIPFRWQFIIVFSGSQFHRFKVRFCRSSTNNERNMIRRTGRRTQRAHLLNQVIFQFPRR